MTMPDRRQLYALYEKQLTPFSTSLVAEFLRSADAMGDQLSDEELGAWAEDGLELARQSLLSRWPADAADAGVGRVPALGRIWA